MVRQAGGVRRHRANYDITIMCLLFAASIAESIYKDIMYGYELVSPINNVAENVTIFLEFQLFQVDGLVRFLKRTAKYVIWSGLPFHLYTTGEVPIFNVYIVRELHIYIYVCVCMYCVSWNMVKNHTIFRFDQINIQCWHLGHRSCPNHKSTKLIRYFNDKWLKLLNMRHLILAKPVLGLRTAMFVLNI